MGGFDLQSIIDAYGGKPTAQDVAHLNPRFHDLLRLTGLDRRFVEGHGPWLIDDSGRRHLDAIGGYADGLTIDKIDKDWPCVAVRGASINKEERWPVVAFSHGSGAYRASYAFWTEHLASHGYVVCACDHPGSARFMVIDGQVITPGGERSKRARMRRNARVRGASRHSAARRSRFTSVRATRASAKLSASCLPRSAARAR